MSHRPVRNFNDEICQPFFLKGTMQHGKKHGILLLHGFTGTIAHMRPVAELLHQQGFTVMGVNLPGHATTMDEMAACTWQDWLEAAKAAFLSLKEKCDVVCVAGLSMGGCLTLIIGEQMQPNAIATISAPMGTRIPLWLATMSRPVLPTVWWRTRNETVSPVDERFDYGYPGFRSQCAAHLSRLIKISRRDLHAVTCPVLVIQSHADTTITADSAQIILQGVSSRRKGVLWLEQAPHVCTISQKAETIAAALAEHFWHAEKD